MSDQQVPKRIAVCPGSFDPITLGHVDIIRRACALWDEVVIAVLHNQAKSGTFAVADRIALIESSLDADLAERVGIEPFAGRLLVDVCRDVGAQVIVKGLRGGTDFAYELPMALMNRHLTGVETVFLPGAPELEHVSSSLVKEVARFGGNVSGLVPEPVLAALTARGDAADPHRNPH